ncbi:hypothetical protein ACOI22_13785 [Glaciecola sp. 2405UD65-10]|uniref:hypothetical protein n=1 Tax=Glaciecola sp. 2405UD65-10 TaxID=3397244 RepID=UPI003B5A9D26
MLKVKLLVVAGIMFILEGYFYVVRGLLPVGGLEQFTNSSDDSVYYKVVASDEVFNMNVLFYFSGLILIALAYFVKRRISVEKRSK